MTETYDFGAFITANGTANLTTSGDAIAQTGTSAKVGSVYVINDLTAGGQTLNLKGRFAVDYAYNASSQIRFMWRSSSNAYQHGLAGNWNSKGTADAQGAARFSVLNLKAGDKITFTYAKQSGKAADPYTCRAGMISAGSSTLAVDAALASNTEYTVATDCNLDLYFTNNNFAISKIVIKTEGVETMGAPSINITGANGNKRTVTITPGVGDGGSAATATYYTTDGTNPTSASTAYTTPFTVSATTTIKAVSYLGANIGTVATKVVEAGTTLNLNAPVITLTAFKANGGAFNPTYSFTSDQSSVVGAPTATLSYSFKGGAATTGTSYTPEAKGTLRVTASADGYTSAYTDLEVTCAEFMKSYVFDATKDITVNDGAPTTYTNYSINSKGCNLYALSNCTFTTYKGISFDSNMQFAWAITADEAYCLFARLNKSTISYSLNEGEYIEFTNFGNPIIASSATTSTQLAWYSPVCQINVYTPASDVFSGTIATSGYSTIACAKPLDLSALPSSVTAFKVSSISNTAVTMDEVTGAVAANTGLVLKGSAGATFAIPFAASGSAVSGNKLKAAVTATEVADNAAYVLKDGKFCLVTAASSVPAGKAYLLASDVPATARELNIGFGDETGITNTNRTNDTNTGEIYNLQGQRLMKATKGLYIQNGRKVLVK